MTETPAATRQDFEARLVARAWSDEGYRARLRSDPRGAIEEETGITVPESITIEVLEETPEQAYLVIPTNRVEIADDELEASGGGDYGHKGEIL
jgi:nitrile hydratase alpha subunit